MRAVPVRFFVVLLVGSMTKVTHGQSSTDVPAAPKPEPKAVILHQADPDLFGCKLRRGQRFVAIASVIVDAKGKPSDIRIHSTSGDACVDDAFVNAIRSYVFRPARRDGVPVMTTTTVTLDTTLF